MKCYRVAESKACGWWPIQFYYMLCKLKWSSYLNPEWVHFRPAQGSSLERENNAICIKNHMATRLPYHLHVFPALHVRVCAQFHTLQSFSQICWDVDNCVSFKRDVWSGAGFGRKIWGSIFIFAGCFRKEKAKREWVIRHIHLWCKPHEAWSKWWDCTSKGSISRGIMASKTSTEAGGSWGRDINKTLRSGWKWFIIFIDYDLFWGA